MKKVRIYELKQGLSSLIAEAEQGTDIIITRHNRPIARLSSAERQYLHVGSRFGRATLQPVLRGKTGGRYLRVLEEDRRSDTDGR